MRKRPRDAKTSISAGAGETAQEVRVGGACRPRGVQRAPGEGRAWAPALHRVPRRQGQEATICRIVEKNQNNTRREEKHW